MIRRSFQIGDKVAKNPTTWIPSEFDGWGAGEGIGEVVGFFDAETVDVHWPAGRCFQQTIELEIVKGSAAHSSS